MQEKNIKNNQDETILSGRSRQNEIELKSKFQNKEEKELKEDLVEHNCESLNKIFSECKSNKDIGIKAQDLLKDLQEGKIKLQDNEATKTLILAFLQHSNLSIEHKATFFVKAFKLDIETDFKAIKGFLQLTFSEKICCNKRTPKNKERAEKLMKKLDEKKPEENNQQQGGGNNWGNFTEKQEKPKGGEINLA